MPTVQLACLDFAKIREADADSFSESAECVAFGVAKLFYPGAEFHDVA